MTQRPIRKTFRFVFEVDVWIDDIDVSTVEEEAIELAGINQRLLAAFCANPTLLDKLLRTEAIMALQTSVEHMDTPLTDEEEYQAILHDLPIPAADRVILQEIEDEGVLAENLEEFYGAVSGSARLITFES